VKNNSRSSNARPARRSESGPSRRERAAFNSNPLLTVALLAWAPHLSWSRLWTFENLSGLPEVRSVWPETGRERSFAVDVSSDGGWPK